MSRAMLAAWLSLTALCAAAAPAAGPCTCAVARETNGWCEPHGVGYVATVPIRSKMLYETLDAHGHVLDLDTFRCDACRKAIATDGFCDQHRIGFVGRLAYFSRLTYELARGERKDPAGITCPVCRKNAGGHGWCDRCALGMVGHVAIKNRLAYAHASKAVEILRLASEAAENCERCAVAIVTDTECPRCRITYKDGRPLPAAAGAAEPEPR